MGKIIHFVLSKTFPIYCIRPKPPLYAIRYTISSSTFQIIKYFLNITNLYSSLQPFSFPPTFFLPSNLFSSLQPFFFPSPFLFPANIFPSLQPFFYPPSFLLHLLPYTYPQTFLLILQFSQNLLQFSFKLHHFSSFSSLLSSILIFRFKSFNFQYFSFKGIESLPQT